MSTTRIEADDSYTGSRRRIENNWSYDQNTRRPMKLTWRQMMSVTLHWRCLTLSLFLFICFSLLVWCKFPSIHSNRVEPCRNGLVWIPGTITLIFYLLYLVECFHSNIHKNFRNVISAENAEVVLQRWINAKPVIRWRAICYHYGRNMRQRYNGGGSAPVPQLQYTRMNTRATEGKYYPYDCGCIDKSTPLTDLRNYSIIKVDIEKTFSFGCSCSEAAYFTQRKAFYERHVTVDDFIELSEIFHLSGSQIPDSLCVVRRDHLPWYCGKVIYWLFSLLCMSWPIRMVIERRTAYAAITIHKEFGGLCDGVLATSAHSISSYDSKMSENVYGIVPSYSEALLMSSYTLNGTRIPSAITMCSKKTTPYPCGQEAGLDSDLSSAHRNSSKSKKLFLSQTADNLRCVQPHNTGYRTVPRSLSLHSPILEHSTLSTSTNMQSEQTTTTHSKSSSNVMKNIKQAFLQTRRSKTFDEQIYLL